MLMKSTSSATSFVDSAVGPCQPVCSSQLDQLAAQAPPPPTSRRSALRTRRPPVSGFARRTPLWLHVVHRETDAWADRTTCPV